MPNRKKNKWWRPSVISEAVVGKLEDRVDELETAILSLGSNT